VHPDLCQLTILNQIYVLCVVVHPLHTAHTHSCGTWVACSNSLFRTRKRIEREVIDRKCCSCSSSGPPSSRSIALKFLRILLSSDPHHFVNRLEEVIVQGGHRAGWTGFVVHFLLASTHQRSPDSSQTGLGW